MKNTRKKSARIASEIRETVILNRDPAARSLYDTIMTTGHSLNPGESFLLSAEMVPDETLLGRVLARISVHDYGYYAQRESHGYRIWRGEIFKRRFWRFLHELNHPDPAKRQGYVHTIGRCYPGLIRAHARYMAETTETKVPGERLFFRKEYSWRPFIPTVDDMLSATRSKNAGKTIRIFSSEGVFSMTGPRDMSERFSLWWYITLNYETLVQKRNYDLEDVQSGHNRNFTQILQEDFGFNIEFHPHAYTYQDKIHQVIDPHVGRSHVSFDSHAIGMETVIMMAERITSTAESLWNLVVTSPTPSMSVVVLMVSILLSGFLIRLIVRRYRIRVARNAIPFVIGGWGTRGKSGTERKKAALFEGLGYNVTSKTTGCEAMIIHARPGQNAVELPIYRPNDKATIWEQGRLVQWAARLDSQVFLWECMALGPDYATTLQHDWMNDDLSTLSNTFVDHENIQGPSGMDVTRALTSFIPCNSDLFTAEDMMIPVLEDVAQARNTRLHTLNWRESDLIGDDVLKQFPYTVHPRNLGMVLKLAAHLDIDPNLALREIVNHIIPDLGSFKCFQIRFRTRFLEFWNGMSANDRVSTVSNFQNAGFYNVTPGDHTWTVTIVNNRDDRIIRSREFADIIVNDTPANLHILIGTNLTGLYGYLMDSIRNFVLRKNLVTASTDTSKTRHSPETLDP